MTWIRILWLSIPQIKVLYGEHGWFDKRFMYEESLHTPLIISYPGHIKEGVENTDMVQNIDFAPTFLAYAGVQQPKGDDG